MQRMEPIDRRDDNPGYPGRELASETHQAEKDWKPIIVGLSDHKPSVSSDLVIQAGTRRTIHEPSEKCLRFLDRTVTW